MSQRRPRSMIRRSQLPLALVIGLLLLLTGVGLESASAYIRSRLAVSSSADRSSSARLDGAVVKGQIYVFLTSPRYLDRVEFYLDDPSRTRPPVRVDTTAPFDLAGTATDRRANPYDTTKLTEGTHSITAVLRWGRSSSVRSATFRVSNQTGTPSPTPSTTTTSAAPSPTTTTTAPSTTPTTAAPTSAAPTPSTTTADPSPTSSTNSPTPTATGSAPSGSWPDAPPARICGNTALLSGPAKAPAGAIVVPAGNNSSVDLEQAGKTYWFAPGVHTLGTGEYSQIIPGTGSTYLGGPGAILDGQGKNKYAFTQHARNVTIKYLTIRNFVAPMNEGTVNHDSGENWTMQYNTVTDNGGAGIFLGAGNVASYNCLKDNSQYGFQAYGAQGGESDILLDHNEIVGNNTGDWESKIEGCGCTGGGKFWDVRNVRVTNNYVHDNFSVALWADTNDNNFLFEGNWIEDNHGQAIFWEISYNVAIRNNVIRHNLTTTGPERIRSDDNFPDAAIYISESGGDARLPHDLVGSPTIDISNNLIEDNYNGVALWENADRFCGSAANTSSGYCTLANPSVAKLSTCTSTNIAKQPYYSDCRWKTQNVKVHHNTFAMNRAKFGNCSASMCGRNAIFSNWGSYPSWSPYKGEVISSAIVHDQGNVFSNNRYVGAWNFTVLDTGKLIAPSAWRGAPYGQDAGSTFGS
jgi:parallel beta helix pectate lyase-like protein